MSNYDLSAHPLFRSVIDGPLSERPKSKRCFVIAPMNDASPDVRLHAETLWKYVIHPALLDTDYSANRIDAPQGSSAIGQPAIDGVLDDDLVIAVLSFRNASVFYQAALAQAAARPLILMIEEGQDLAFEPRGAKVLTYSLDADSMFSAVNVNKLQQLISQITETDAPILQGFRPGASALNGGGNGGASVFERSPQFTYDQRLQMMREARTRIDMMGVANLAIAMHPDTAELIRSRSGQGVEIRILQCAPTNAGLISLVGTRDGQRLDSVRQEIETAADAWKRIVDLPDLAVSISLRRAQISIPLASALITDRAVVTTPYLRSRTTAESPTLYAHAGSAYHRVMSQEFDTIWSEAAPLFRAEPRLVRQEQANLNSAQSSDLPPTDSTRLPPSGGLRSFAVIRGIGRGS
jgi:hypothetical protein